jgi:hypothetical protein
VLRSEFWKHLSQSSNLVAKNAGVFESLLRHHSPCEPSIRADVSRTLSDHQFFGDILGQQVHLQFCCSPPPVGSFQRAAGTLCL